MTRTQVLHVFQDSVTSQFFIAFFTSSRFVEKINRFRSRSRGLRVTGTSGHQLLSFSPSFVLAQHTHELCRTSFGVASFTLLLHMHGRAS